MNGGGAKDNPDFGINLALCLSFSQKSIETKPIHAYQKNKWLDANTLEVRLELIPNYEFERLVLSYAESVKVISPP